MYSGLSSQTRDRSTVYLICDLYVHLLLLLSFLQRDVSIHRKQAAHFRRQQALVRVL